MAFRKRSKNKFHRTVVNFDGYRFDSKVEFDYYMRLKIFKAAGTIKDFTVHPKIALAAGIEYVADYSVTDNNGAVRIVDVKCDATITSTFRLKARLFRDQFPGVPLIIAKGIYKGGTVVGFDEREFGKRKPRKAKS